MGFEKIIGYENEKKELMQLQSMLRGMKKYRKKGVRMPKGLMLFGAPGVGKTLMAKSIAEAEGISLVQLRAADCCETDLDDAIYEAFKEAKQKRPAVLLLDELDKIAGTSEEFYKEINEEVKKLLLQELDELKDEDDVLVVATCNEMSSLGHALTRSGRFDHVLEISMPEQETRKLILEYYFGKIDLKKECSFEDLAKITDGMSCADLECIANEAGMQAVNRNKGSIETIDVVTIINRLNFRGCEKETLKGKELYRVAVHEAGHTLTAIMLMPESVYGASVLPQGRSLGHTRLMEEKEREYSMEEMRWRICISLAGRIAEREILGETYTGCLEDLRQAALNMMSLITDYGAYGYRYLINGNITIPQSAAEEEAGAFGKLFEQQMNELDAQVTGIIQKNHVLFDAIVQALITEKTLTRKQLFELKEEAEKKGKGSVVT